MTRLILAALLALSPLLARSAHAQEESADIPPPPPPPAPDDVEANAPPPPADAAPPAQPPSQQTFEQQLWPGWVVVPHAHFTAPIRRWAVPRAQMSEIVRSSRPVRAFPSYRAHAFNGRGGGHRGGGRGRR